MRFDSNNLELNFLTAQPPPPPPPPPFDTVLAYEDDTSDLSSIESPLSSARKRFSTQLMDEYLKNIKAGMSPEEMVASLEKKILKRNRTIPDIGKRKSKNSSFLQKLNTNDDKETKTLDYPPSFIEASMISDIEADCLIVKSRGSYPAARRRASIISGIEAEHSIIKPRESYPAAIRRSSMIGDIGADYPIVKPRDSYPAVRRRRSLLSTDDSLSTLTQEDKPLPDLSQEIMDFFDKHRKIKRRESLRNNIQQQPIIFDEKITRPQHAY